MIVLSKGKMMAEDFENQPDQPKTFGAAEGYAGLGASTGGPAEKMKALMAAKGPESTEGPETEKQLESGDIETLRARATELQGMARIQHGLELNIVGGGLQEMADRYGGGRLLDAMTATGSEAATTIGELRAKLSPNKADLAELDAEIDKGTADVRQIGQKMNEALGGVASGLSADTDNLGIFRRNEMAEIRDGKTRVLRRRVPGRPTDAANDLLTGDLNALVAGHPELGEGLRKSNDTLALLKGIRDIYEKEYADFTAAMEQTRAEIESRVSAEEAEATRLRDESDEQYAATISVLERQLETTASDPEAHARIQGLMKQRQAEASAAHDELTAKIGAVRGQVLAELGAESIDSNAFGVPSPAEPEAVYSLNERGA